MSVITEFLRTNYMWIFSGIGVFIVSLFFIKKGGKKVKNSIKKGNGNAQAGRDIITYQTKKRKDEHTVK